MRTTLPWLALITLVALAMVFVCSRAVVFAGVATPFTTWRMNTTKALFPDYGTEIVQLEGHSSTRALLTSVHLATGSAFLILGLLQFSPSIRARHLRFHRRSGYVLVTLALIAGPTGIWLGVVQPFSTTESLPAAGAGLLFVIAPVIAVRAIRRGEVRRHREWMIRFFATGIAAVVIRLVLPPLIWLLRPMSLHQLIGLSFWAGWLVALTVAEAWIRWTRGELVLTSR